MRRFILPTIAVACLASPPLFPASAKGKKSTAYCQDSYAACYKSCGVKGTGSDVGDRCRNRCDMELAECSKSGKGASNKGPDRTSVPKGGTWQGPKTQHKGGTWHGPTSPPKAPVGPSVPIGGVWKQSPGGGGPILKSGGKR
jgi:hypothetical protein